MAGDFNREPMLDMFIFETLQLIEQLEVSVLNSEKAEGVAGSINEIFRMMHTIKGSAAMMLFDGIADLAHSLEDVFFYLREEKPSNVDYSKLTDIVLEGIDFIKVEVEKLEKGKKAEGQPGHLIEVIQGFLSSLKTANGEKGAEPSQEQQKEEEYGKYYLTSCHAGNLPSKRKYKATLFFEDGCEMENIRAFTVIHKLKEIAGDIQFWPQDIVNNPQSIETIQKEGFKIVFDSDLGLEEVKSFLAQTIFLKELQCNPIEHEDEILEYLPSTRYPIEEDTHLQDGHGKDKPLENGASSTKQSLISVNVTKLDVMMDLMGELVISEAMVTQNPDLQGLQMDNFYKAARQLKKIINELQDTVMSIRMVSLAPTFQKMNRIVRDMGKKLNKRVQLEVIGQDTEVDKNIIENISDPLMHLIRNAIDHGIEAEEERVRKGKPEAGKIVLEAKNAGGDVWIIVKDDGKGLDRDKILEKAWKNGIVTEEQQLTDQEIYSFIFAPGFSTKEAVTEFSGRGVGMDVVMRNIQNIGGNVVVDSIPGEGTTLSIKIPLTLAIIDGMIVRIGSSTYTVPTTSIQQSFRPQKEDIITDTDGNEMILVRGVCCPIIRLHRLYNVETQITELHEGIILLVENNAKLACIFADELVGQQQVVVKTLPKYIKKVRGVEGCTLLGDGSISLILDTSALLRT